MEIQILCGCGLDVHQATVVACLLKETSSRKAKKEMRTFGTTTRELINLQDWLVSAGCTHVAMESTGVYWKPIYAILEGSFEIVVANAQHIKKVPGRKTDVRDAEWIADLLCHGLLRKSFVPPPPIRELRDLTRYRRKLVESQASERNRLLKVLESANIKLSSVATDVFGLSGRMMIRALIDGSLTIVTIYGLATPMGAVKLVQVGYAMSSVTAIPTGKQVKSVSWPVRMYEGFCSAGTSLQSPFLLAVRLYWGWQFAQTGRSTLHHLAQIAEFFRSLSIPLPGLNAHIASGLKCVGELALIAGPASRPTGFLLAGNMFVAYWTANPVELVSVFSDPGKFYGADLYTFFLLRCWF